MKKEVKIVISIFLAIWIFVMGVEIGVYKEKTREKETTTVPVITTTATTTMTTTTTQPVVTTTQSTTEGSTAIDVNATESTTASTTASTTSSAEMSKAEIVAAVSKYVNQVKSEQNMTAVKDESIVVNIVDLSVSFLRDTVNSVIKNLVGDGPSSTTFTFVNGQTEDGKTPYSEIPPCNKDYTLTAEGVADAKVEKVGDNTVYTITIVEEHTTKDSPIPTYNSQAIGYLDITSLDIPLEITTANMHYPGSTVEITVNANDKVIKAVYKLPMSGEGAVSLGSASFEGGLDESWEFTY